MTFSVSLFHAATPLVVPYVSSLGVTAQIDSVFALVRLADGRTGCSEVTPIAGYNEESLEEIWAQLNRLAQSVVALEPEFALQRVEACAADAPYACSPLAAALEEALGRLPDPIAGGAAPIAVIAPVLSRHIPDVHAEVAALMAAGYTTLKVKAGMDFERDLVRIAEVRRSAGRAARLRIDFNGAYDAQTAMRFVARLDPAGIELIEQPCAAEDWDGNLRVAQSTPIPTMLDESIRGIADVRRAGALGAFRFFKMKLGKFPTLASIENAYVEGEALGMHGILGNGAATDVACRLEACIAGRHREHAGEMNGFAKNAVQYLRTPLSCVQGGIETGALPENRVDAEALLLRALRSAEYGTHEQAGTP